MFAGFQSSSFQRNAFQIGGFVIETPNGNNGRKQEYVPTHYELENHRKKLEKYKDSEREAVLELSSVQYKIDELELKRLRDLADESMQLELLALLKEQSILNQLLLELQINKERWRREEDDLLIILMSLPFNA